MCVNNLYLEEARDLAVTCAHVCIATAAAAPNNMTMGKVTILQELEYTIQQR
jgi:hypothetical protein